MPLVASLAIILAVSVVGDDTGVRLALPVYALMALLGAVAVVELWDHGASSIPARRLVRATVASIIGAAVLVPLRTHPDYLAYFNAIGELYQPLEVAVVKDGNFTGAAVIDDPAILTPPSQ